jgi:uncharacterized membrane protein
MNDHNASTSGIALLLSVLGWVAAIVAAVYAAYMAMVVRSSGETVSWTLPLWGVCFGMLFVAVSKIIEKLNDIEDVLRQERKP